MSRAAASLDFRQERRHPSVGIRHQTLIALADPAKITTLVVWTTSGTFMLMFLAALQNLPALLDEAGLIDGASDPLSQLLVRGLTRLSPEPTRLADEVHDTVDLVDGVHGVQPGAPRDP